MGAESVRLDGKVVVLNGAGGSLGGALASAFADAGACALALGDLRRASVEEVAGDLPASCQVLAQEVDVRDQDSVRALTSTAIDRFGRVDVVVNNAGVLSPNGRIHNLSDDVWRTAFDVNVLGAVHGTVAGFEAMRTTGGSIINTASVAGMTAWTHAGPYGVTKAAVIHLTKVAALEYAPERVRVNCVCPGVFPSAMHRDLPDEVLSSLGAKHPLGLGAPADLVGAYLYLGSDSSRWTTGSALVVDGGYAAP